MIDERELEDLFQSEKIKWKRRWGASWDDELHDEELRDLCEAMLREREARKNMTVASDASELRELRGVWKLEKTTLMELKTSLKNMLSSTNEMRTTDEEERIFHKLWLRKMEKYRTRAKDPRHVQDLDERMTREAIANLRRAGYTVTPPATKSMSETVPPTINQDSDSLDIDKEIEDFRRGGQDE